VIKLNTYLKGDRHVWTLALLLALASLPLVYSASTQVAYLVGGGNTFSFLAKHMVHLMLGFVLMYLAHRIPYKYYSGLTLLLMPAAIILLVVTLAQGTTIGEANAARWIRIPGLGWTFQTSAFAILVLLMYVARWLNKHQNKPYTFKESWWLVGTIGLVFLLILPANFSTAALSLLLVATVLFAGGYPIKYLLYLGGMAVAGLGLFILVVTAFPNISNRVETWKARIEHFGSENPEENYQVNKAKMAIATGGVTGQGFGKSVQRNFLPQSNSDFIFAIITEEYGVVGALTVLAFYFYLFIRVITIAHKADSLFGRMLALGIGLNITFQALINMGVAVNLLPVTGQTLPLVSAGGSSIWMHCLGLGVLLSISRGSLTDQQETGEFTFEEPTHEVQATA
jgi:cell division protein FtsW